MAEANRKLNLLVAAGVSVAFLAPMLLLIAGFANTRIIDNRQLAPFPAFTAASVIDTKFYTGVKNYLVDRFPFRPHVIVARGHFMQNHLADFNNDRIVWGKDGWMFLREAIRFSCHKPELVVQAVRGMTTFTEYVRGMGKDVVFMIAPNKATIYPEKVASRFAPYLACEDKHRALFHAMVAKRSGTLRYIDVFAPTRAARKRWPLGVYSWFDVHWDCRGTAILGDLVLRDLFADPKLKIPLVYEPEPRVSDISVVLGRPFEAEWTGCKSTAPLKAVREDDNKDNYFAAFKSTAPAPADGKGRVLMIHDSFANGLRQLMPPLVPAFTMYNINNRDFDKLARAIHDADKIYVEIVERSAFANFARLGHPNFIRPLDAAMKRIANSNKSSGLTVGAGR